MDHPRLIVSTQRNDAFMQNGLNVHAWLARNLFFMQVSFIGLQALKALMRLHVSAGLPKPILLVYVFCTKIS